MDQMKMPISEGFEILTEINLQEFYMVLVTDIYKGDRVHIKFMLVYKHVLIHTEIFSPRLMVMTALK